jgi:hypothetical protein
MHKQFNPFAHSPSPYGAKIGRYHGNPCNLQDVKRLACRHQGGSEGYDRGGAYWGYPFNVYGAWAKIDGDIICAYVRASSRNDAIIKVRAGELE